MLLSHEILETKPVSIQGVATLVELLRRRAMDQPDQIAYTFLMDREGRKVHLSYADLDQKARTIAAVLQDLGVSGKRAILLFPPGLEFITAFWGCLYAGVVAVPVSIPRRSHNLSSIHAIVADANPVVGLTTKSFLASRAALFNTSDLSRFRWCAVDDFFEGIAEKWQFPLITNDSLGFLQYTSGSTGQPKGVMLTHGNLLHNSEQIYQKFGHSPRSRGVSWLPTFHDMGLIGGVLQPIYGGFPCTLMSPVSFLQSPFRWLQAISQEQATTSGGPNFAYELCARVITLEQRESLDLSCWRLAFTGAEPIREETLARFAKVFKSSGFCPEAFYPCYGLAEATLIVSGSIQSETPIVKNLQKKALLEHRWVEDVSESHDTQKVVGCGQSISGQEILIVNPETKTECEADQIGEIWVTGPSIAKGYWKNPEATEAAFQATLSNGRPTLYFRTGDLGILRDGELFITGRLKALVVIKGKNHYPQDIELTVEQCCRDLRSGCGSAFSVEMAGEERLVVVQELTRHPAMPLEKIIGAIRLAIAKHHKLEVYAVVLIKTGTILKTSSGKVKRSACRERYLNQDLNVVFLWYGRVPREKLNEGLLITGRKK